MSSYVFEMLTSIMVVTARACYSIGVKESLLFRVKSHV